MAAAEPANNAVNRPTMVLQLTLGIPGDNFWNRFTDGLQVDIEAEEQVGLIRATALML